MKTTNEPLSKGGHNTLDISTITCNSGLCSGPPVIFTQALRVRPEWGSKRDAEKEKWTKRKKEEMKKIRSDDTELRVKT